MKVASNIRVLTNYNMIFRGCRLNNLYLNDSCITQCTFRLVLQFFFDFVTWPPFTEMCDTIPKGGKVTKPKKIVRLT